MMQGHAECLESAGTEKAILPSGSQNVAGFPVWHVVPQLLERSTLQALLDELSAHPAPRRANVYILAWTTESVWAPVAHARLEKVFSKTEEGKVDTARVVAAASEGISWAFTWNGVMRLRRAFLVMGQHANNSTWLWVQAGEFDG
jgi:hypothetical protein